MTTTESDKEDRIEKRKQEYWDYLDHIVHPSKYTKTARITQEEGSKKPEKSIEDMEEEEFDANARIRGELLDKRREETYLRYLLSRQKTTKSKITHADFLKENRERQEKKLDDTEVWKRGVEEEFSKQLVAERNAKFGTGEGMTKTQWEKHIRSKIEALVDERKERQRELT